MRTLIATVLVLSGCATFQPELGTSLSLWQSECQKRTLVGGQLVAAAENVKAYTCNTGGQSAGVVYIFQDERLVQVTTNAQLAALAQQRAQAAGELGTDLLLLQQLSQ